MTIFIHLKLCRDLQLQVHENYLDLLVPNEFSPSGWKPQIDRKISLNNQVENSFFRISNISVPCPHAQLRGRTVIKNYGHFSDLGVGIALSHRYIGFFG